MALFKRKKEKQLEGVILEIEGREVELYPLKFKQSLTLAESAEKKNFFLFMEDFIKTATNLDERFIRRMEIRDAIGLLVYHRFYFWENLEVTDNPPLLPTDFLYEREFKKEKFSLNGTSFKNHTSLESIQKAEKLCIIEGGLDMMNLYLLSAFAETPKKGIDAILGADDTTEVRNFVNELNSSIRSNGDVALDFIADLKELSLISNDNYSISLANSSFFLHYQKQNIFYY